MKKPVVGNSLLSTCVCDVFIARIVVPHVGGHVGAHVSKRVEGSLKSMLLFMQPSIVDLTMVN